MPHPPNRFNKLRLVRQETKVFTVTVVDGDKRAAKLNGADVVLTVSESAGGVAVLTKNVGNGVLITDASKGKATITLTSADTAGLEAKTYKYDVWVVYPDDPPVRHPVIRSADLIVSESVTDFSAVS